MISVVRIKPLHDPLFWARYTFAHDDGPGSDRLGELTDALAVDEEGEETEVEFAVGGGHRLVLSVDTGLDSHELAVGSADLVELAWDDLAHWHPFALRWDELDLICRAVALVDPGQHPGAPLALLCRFAAVFTDKELLAYAEAVDAAYTSLRPAGWTGYWPRAADWLERADFRGKGVTWHRDDAGDLVASPADDEADFYSTRVRPHPQLTALLNAAATTTGD
jgi:hypothetical protein